MPDSPALPPFYAPETIILASGSPRRKALLEDLGLMFEVILPTLDESQIAIDHLQPHEAVQHLAHAKGESIAQQYPDALVIAADTLVSLGEQVLGKPMDTAEAHQMLSQLQGTTHSVFSAIAVFYRGCHVVDAWETRVTMRPLSTAEIARYVASGEPMDKAGAYAIQGQGSVLVTRIEGCYFNVVGMSLALLEHLCRHLCVSLMAQPATVTSVTRL